MVRGRKMVLESVTGKFVKETEGGVPLHEMEVGEAREVLESLQRGYEEVAGLEVVDLKMAGVSVRIVRPRELGKSQLPGLLYLHGGGWILGSKFTHDRLIRDLALGTQAAVVFVNYFPAPEEIYPGQLAASYLVAEYLATYGYIHNIDPHRLAIMGDSVGGNLAAALVLMAQVKQTVSFKYQVLAYPVLNDDFSSPSYQEFAEGPWLTKANMEWFWDAYCPEKKLRDSPYVCPLKAPLEMLVGLPPTLLLTDDDVLRSEGEAYADRLMQAQVPVTSLRVRGTIHDFLMLNALADTPATLSSLELIHLKLRLALSH